ncbi:FG-GAP-like repeat-containing protein [Fulvivirgaceae bacterium BMA10]|uniref:FG-GAP-like repeat-containing protein n=1 Tax=Splendidivirga corallicola TaxID=3051826 RepID=A0ABT8KU71_9BACT|nr:FG-GAP-like repeat-containing protein [Fulvivirgaceae bacterium BMA10]
MKIIRVVFFLCLSTSLQAQFLEESKDVGIEHVCHDPNQMSAGVAFFDFNNDGFEDIVVTGSVNRNKVFENQGDGTFSDVTEALDLEEIHNFNTTGVITADFDNDGFTDLYFGTYLGDRSYLFWNEDGKRFKEAAVSAGLDDMFMGTSFAVADYNLDGYLDLYAGNYGGSDFLYKNNGDRTFSDQGHLLDYGEGVGSALAVAFSDVDTDGDMDILLGNEFDQIPQLSNLLFINNYPENSFTEVSELMSWDLRINTMGIATGDYDEDGDFDYYVTDISDNYFFQKNEGLKLEEKAYALDVANDGSTSWGTVFFDFDNDTYLDLFVANGNIGASITESEEDRLFKGSDTGVFLDISESQKVNSSFRSRGVSTGDYNNDGRMDILVGVMWYESAKYENSHNLLYRNLNETGNWLKLKLEGVQSNRDAYGAFIKVTADGRTFIREQTGGGSYMSHNSKTIHVGLGDYDSVEKLEVHWPNGAIDSYENLEVNTTYLAVEQSQLFAYSSQRIDLCQDGSITIGETTYTEEGIYRDTLRDNTGLDKIVIMRVARTETPCVITAIEDEVLENQSLNLYPNPVHDYFNINLPSGKFARESEIQWTLIDMNGRVVRQGSQRLNRSYQLKIFGLGGLPKGTYFVKVNQSRVMLDYKMVLK